MTPIKPSQVKKWEDIDQTKANLQFTGGMPELYSWYEKDGVWFAHRTPTIHEIYYDEFN